MGATYGSWLARYWSRSSENPGPSFCRSVTGRSWFAAGRRTEVVFWPESGEYVNMTHFVTDPHFERHVEFECCDEPIEEAALLTDGLQRLVLDFALHRPHGPFFAPAFQTLRACGDPRQLAAPLREFLGSSLVDERSDDDRTLILATRADADGQVL